MENFKLTLTDVSPEVTIDDLTKISLEYTPDLINSLSNYDDEYSKKLAEVFKRFSEHKSFELMRKELEPIEPDDNVYFHNRWDFNTRAFFLEVIYPAA
ncbi:hypothetical protein [Chryseobacterium indologenes]|uniref:Uncharacterized protein n=1 Tax=Chryseobacterium indologenes TaxID=253 RepID=A0A0N0IV09_CHRID|nr:hypothetical protein [Chryseobacterium indologenes]KPE50123.1 hypothetical protein AOB46_16930 [Chryseobacterium indologenes]